MEYPRLGLSGLKVSRICLGTASFGERTSAPVAARIVGSAFDAGVNFIDTADSYPQDSAPGESERIVGRLIASQRDNWVLATKFSRQTNAKDPNCGGLGRKWMMQAVDGSLKAAGDRLHRCVLSSPRRSTDARGRNAARNG